MGPLRRWRPWLLLAVPSLFLLICFAIPNAFLLTASFLESEDQVLTGKVTLGNYAYVLGRPIYRAAIYRTFGIGAAVGAGVVLLGYPVAFFLNRTSSAWKGALTALALTPLLASVIVRTYGWWVLLNREGAINMGLARLGWINEPVAFLPSSAAIAIGLIHSFLPFAVLTMLAALNGVNPNIERAAMSLGASTARTFLEVTLPLSRSGIIGAFLLGFTLSISAYATPSILGGPASETMPTLIYKFMMTVLDWSTGSAIGAILILSALLLLTLGSALGGRRATLA